MKANIDYTLYLVTDRELMSTKTLEEAVEQAVLGGCSVVQLREKILSSKEFLFTALKIKAITENYNIPLIINDRVDIMLAADADGVHIGQDDLPADIVRRLIGENKLLGVSVSTVSEARRAVLNGADYIGVGAMYPTGTKTDAKIVSFDELKRIRAAVSIPAVVIGGINKKTIPDFKGIGIDGLAVVSAVISQDDIANASRELTDAFMNIRSI